MIDFVKNLGNLLDYRYWFDMSPEPFLPSIVGVVYGFFILLIIMSIASKLMTRKIKGDAPLQRVWHNLYMFFAVMGLTGLLIVFFRQQMVTFMGSPFWMLIWLIGAAIWIYIIVKYIKVRLPQIREEAELKKEIEKYLPKKS